MTSLGWVDPRTVRGQLMWPGRFGPEQIEQLKRILGPYGWASQYQMNPAPREGGIFKRTWLREHRPDPEYPDRVSIDEYGSFDPMAEFRFCIVDPAVAEKEVSPQKTNDPDYFVIQTYAVFLSSQYADGSRLPVLVLLDQMRARLEGPDQLPAIQAMARRWRPAIIAVETVAYQLALFQAARRAGLPVREISTKNDPSVVYRIDKDKVARAYAATPLLADNRFFTPAYASWLSDFVRELTTFPNADHDDQVDCVSAAVAIAEKAARSLVPHDAPKMEKAQRQDDTMIPQEQDEEPKPWQGFTVPKP